MRVNETLSYEDDLSSESEIRSEIPILKESHGIGDDEGRNLGSSSN